MKVIICGGGMVGSNIASYLSREDNDITVIETDPASVTRINETMDVRTLHGHAASPEMLSTAGAKDADIIIAVTSNDEVNMVACQVAHSLFGVPKKVARIRGTHFLSNEWANLFSRSHMPIDHIISPEREVAKSTNMRLSVPGTTNVIPMAEEKIYLCGVMCRENCPLVNTHFSQIKSLFSDIKMQIVSIIRQDSTIIPDENSQMLIGDEVYFLCDSKHLQRVLSAFGHDEQKAKHIIIVGGGIVGKALVKNILESDKKISVKLIESDRKTAEKLSGEFEGRIIVINGNGLDKNILTQAGVNTAETFVSVTGDDENNILMSLMAKQYGCERAITLIDKTDYTTLLGSIGIDVVVSPKAITVSSVMKHVRRGRIKAVHSLRDGFAEAIEAEVTENSSICNKKVKDISDNEGIIFGMLIRNDEITIPTDDTTITNGDRLIIIAKHEAVKNVEKMFSAQVDIF